MCSRREPAAAAGVRMRARALYVSRGGLNTTVRAPTREHGGTPHLLDAIELILSASRAEARRRRWARRVWESEHGSPHRGARRRRRQQVREQVDELTMTAEQLAKKRARKQVLQLWQWHQQERDEQER